MVKLGYGNVDGKLVRTATTGPAAASKAAKGSGKPSGGSKKAAS